MRMKYESVRPLLSKIAELEAQQPRVWTAETIGDAPEGEYRCNYDDKWSVNGTRPKHDIIHQMEADKVRISHGAKPVMKWNYLFFGPIPQPTTEAQT